MEGGEEVEGMRGIWFNHSCLDFFKRGGGFRRVPCPSIWIPSNWGNLEGEWKEFKIFQFYP